jgi:RNase P subunit RPR2
MTAPYELDSCTVIYMIHTTAETVQHKYISLTEFLQKPVMFELSLDHLREICRSCRR